jgi:hypothetical protein
MIDTAKILRFLQTHKFDLAREIPGFIDINMPVDGSLKLVLRVSSPLISPPIINFEGEEIPLDIKIDFPDSKPVEKAVVISSPMNPSPTMSQAQDQIGVVALPEKKAVGAHEQGGRKLEAFEAWKKRHKSVKVV